MPTLITRGVSSAYAFGLTTATGGRFGWMAMLTPSPSYQVSTYGIRITSGGSYVLGTSFGATGYGSEYVVTIDTTGTTISSNTVFDNSGSNLYNNVNDIALDTSDNIYSVGWRYQATPSCCGSYTYAYWVGFSKTNASSSNLGSTYFGSGSGVNPYFTSIGRFSDGTMLISGYTYTNNTWPAIVKLNSSLTTVSWGFQKNSSVNFVAATAIDSSDNVVALQIENGNGRLNILKITSAGSITYKKYLSGFGNYFWGTFAQGTTSKPTFDSSSNIYFTGNYFYQQPACCCNFYYLPRSMALSVDSTSSTLRFAKGYVGNSTIQNPTAMVKDSSDNMYFANYYNGNGTIIFKINSSGVLQWARSITGSATPYTGITGTTNITIDGTNFVISMMGLSTNRVFVLKMPTDGSGSGTSFSLGGFTFTYGTPTDFSVIDLTGLTISTDTSSSWTSYTPSLTTTGIAPAASTAYTITNKKI